MYGIDARREGTELQTIYLTGFTWRGLVGCVGTTVGTGVELAAGEGVVTGPVVGGGLAVGVGASVAGGLGDTPALVPW